MRVSFSEGNNNNRPNIKKERSDLLKLSTEMAFLNRLRSLKFKNRSCEKAGKDTFTQAGQNKQNK